jgi:hypothetical protein
VDPFFFSSLLDLSDTFFGYQHFSGRVPLQERELGITGKGRDDGEKSRDGV